MSEDLNLPASLERLEINPERLDCCKMDQNRNILLANPITNVSSEPECTLQGLSLKADCPKGNCNCNRKREKETTVKRLPFKRPIVRRSKLNPLVLRSPVLRLRESPGSGAVVQPCSRLAVAGNTGSTTVAPTCSRVHSVSPTLTQESNSFKPLAQRLSSSSDEDRLCSDDTDLPGSVVSNALPHSSSNASSCAVQARSSPDDTTIDELASYFDLFVHIPKKMSFMAEMMYT